MALSAMLELEEDAKKAGITVINETVQILAATSSSEDEFKWEIVSQTVFPNTEEKIAPAVTLSIHSEQL